MDRESIKSKINIITRHVNSSLKDKNMKEAVKGLNNLSLIHGNVIKQINSLKNNTDTDLKILSELSIVSSNLVSVITDIENEIKKFETPSDLIEAPENKQIKMNSPTLILFYADWCGPCKGFLPLWKQINDKNNNRNDINIVKYSCVKYKEICDKIKFIESYPTILLYKPDINKIIPFTENRSFDTIKQFVFTNTNVNLNQ